VPVFHASHRNPSIVETAVIKQFLVRLRVRWQQQTDHRSGETELRPAASGYCRALLPGIEGERASTSTTSLLLWKARPESWARREETE
jgi:hypothetical protein